MKVEVYLRNIEVEITYYYSNPIFYLRNTKFSLGISPLIFYKKIREIPEEDRKVLEIAKKLANSESLKVYDVCSLSGKIRARIKGIKEFPALLVNGKRIDLKNFKE